MSFNEPKKIGQELAALVLHLANSAKAEQFISGSVFTPEQSQRFRFGLSIINMVTVTWLINSIVQDWDRAKPIIESLHRAYQGAIVVKRIPTRIGDLIPYEEERQLLHIEMMPILGGAENIENVESSIGTLTPIVYNLRKSQYLGDIEAGVKEMTFNPDNPERLGPMFHVARRFAVHFTGEKAGSDDSSLVVKLSVLFGQYFKALSGYCEQKLGK